MNNYSIALFFHLVGALGFFISLGLEWASLRHVLRATSAEQVREWLQVPNDMKRVGMISMLILLAAGFYMMATVWHGVAWIIVTLGAIVLMIILGMAVTGRRMAAIEHKVNTEHGPLSFTLHSSLHDPVLWISMQTRVAIALGIVFLMTIKPDFAGSLLTIAAAIILGIASALPLSPRKRAGWSDRQM